MKITPKENFIISNQDLLNAGYKTNELLPCPFCGNEFPLSGGRKNEDNGNVVYSIRCGGLFKCSANVFTCLGGEETTEKARAEVVAQWNKRMEGNGNG